MPTLAYTGREFLDSLHDGREVMFEGSWCRGSACDAEYAKAPIAVVFRGQETASPCTRTGRIRIG